MYQVSGHFTAHPLSNPKKMRGFLSQQDFWVNASLQKIFVNAMDADYLLGTMIWLLKRASAVKFTFEMYYRSKGANAERLEQLENLTAEKFIRDTPLFRAMQTRYLELMQEDELVIPSISLAGMADSDKDNDSDDFFPDREY